MQGLLKRRLIFTGLKMSNCKGCFHAKKLSFSKVRSWPIQKQALVRPRLPLRTSRAKAKRSLINYTPPSSKATKLYSAYRLSWDQSKILTSEQWASWSVSWRNWGRTMRESWAKGKWITLFRLIKKWRSTSLKLVTYSIHNCSRHSPTKTNTIRRMKKQEIK